MEPISSERSETYAANLLKSAREITKSIDLLNALAREGWTAITSESESYEVAVLDGEKVAVALKTIAMRLDRAALVKFVDNNME
jgi:hypothetical protein